MTSKKGPGRNDPCPCGSGKKYKKCCLRLERRVKSIRTSASEMRKKFEAAAKAEQQRRRRFGELRPVISTNYRGYRMVAVGNQVHWSEKWKTFPDFLHDYAITVLGADWGNAELQKPVDERHQIIGWYQAMCRLQQKQHRDANGIYAVVPNGAMKSYLLLAYDLYTIRHNSTLQSVIVSRLKHKDQFQGARHELFAAATCIRAGCDLAFEDESDEGRKHPEFIATHRTTGQKLVVEAKSRHRPGVLGFAGQRKPDNAIQPDVRGLLIRAFQKPKAHPFVIFVDLNLPPWPLPLTDSPGFREMMDTVVDVASDPATGCDRFNLLVFSNFPYHYGNEDQPAPRGDVISIPGRNPCIPATHPETLIDLHEAALKFGTIPMTFEDRQLSRADSGRFEEREL